MQRTAHLSRRAAIAALGALVTGCTKDEPMIENPEATAPPKPLPHPTGAATPRGAVDRACYACRSCGAVLFGADEIVERRPLWRVAGEKNEVYVLRSASGMPALRRYDASLHEGWYCCRFALMRMVVDKFGTGDALLAYVDDVSRVEPGHVPRRDGATHSGQVRVTADELDDLLLRDQGDHLAVLKLSATWCPPCRVMDKVIAAISEEGDLPDVRFYEVDIDAEPALAERFAVQSLPTMLFFYRGRELPTSAVHGAIARSDLVQLADVTLAAARVP